MLQVDYTGIAVCNSQIVWLSLIGNSLEFLVWDYGRCGLVFAAIG